MQMKAPLIFEESSLVLHNKKYINCAYFYCNLPSFDDIQ